MLHDSLSFIIKLRQAMTKIQVVLRNLNYVMLKELDSNHQKIQIMSKRVENIVKYLGGTLKVYFENLWFLVGLEN